MGSRLGSLIVLILLAGVVAVAAFLIIRLELLSSDPDSESVMIVSLEDDELLLINEPLNINVTITSGAPVTSLALFIDDVGRASSIPAYSQERGYYVGSFPWTPNQLGFTDLRIVAVDEQGQQTVRQLRVEVTDDPQRIAAAFRLTVSGVEPLQQLTLGEPVSITLRTQGAQAIERFEMLIDGELVSTTPPGFDDEDESFFVRFEWTPVNRGDTGLTFRAVTTGGLVASQAIPVIVVSTAARSDTSQTDSDAQTDSAQQQEAAPAPDGDARVIIASPDQDDRFTLSPNFRLSAEIAAENTGPLSEVLLFVTPVASDGSLGESILVHSAAAELPPDGQYRETIDGLEAWLSTPGAYELEVVALTPDDQRFEHRILIRIAAPDPEREGDSDQQVDDREPDAADLALISARQSASDPGRINVTLANLGDTAVESVSVSVTAFDPRDGAQLDAVFLAISLQPDEQAVVPLDLDADQSLELLIVLEAEPAADADPDNNSLQLRITASDEPADGTDDTPSEQTDPTDQSEPAADDQVEDDQAEQAEQTDSQIEQDEESGQDDQSQQVEQEEPAPTESAEPLPDLTLQEANFTHDGFALLTIFNRGDAPAANFVVSILAPDGAVLETVLRGVSSPPLAAGQSELLAGAVAHSGDLRIVVDPDDTVSESDETNNIRTTTVE